MIYYSEPLISIMLPVYNSEKDIKECIISILKQTYKNFELIIVDDCSTDKSLKMINKFKDSRIKILKNERNLGVYCSRNLAIQNSKGEYITGIDSDDIVSPEHLKKLYNCVFNSKKIKIVYSKSLRVKRGKIYEHNGPVHVTGFFHKSLINEIGYFDSVRIMADLEFRKRIIKIFGDDSWKAGSFYSYYYNETRQNSLQRSEKYRIREQDKSINPMRRYYFDQMEKWHNSLRFGDIGSAYVSIDRGFSERPFPINKYKKELLPTFD